MTSAAHAVLTPAPENGISVVIPTLNESIWLPRLVNSLRQIQVSEIIVADFNSTDDTAKVARDLHCVVVSGGRPGVGRNNGARKAKFDTVIFADADVVPSSAVLMDGISLLQKGFVGVHYCYEPLTKKSFPRFCYRVMDFYVRALRMIGTTQGVGSLMIVKRRALWEAGGFDERIKVGEDADFLRRLSKIGPVAYYCGAAVPISARRFFLENNIAFASKCVLWAILRLFGTKFSLIKYRWELHNIGIFQSEDEHLRSLK